MEFQNRFDTICLESGIPRAVDQKNFLEFQNNSDKKKKKKKKLEFQHPLGAHE